MTISNNNGNFIAIENALDVFRNKRQMPENSTRISRLCFRIRYQFQSFYFNHPPNWRLKLRRRLPFERMHPEFATLGAVRSGTSTLAAYVMQHPSVVLPMAKEIDSLSWATLMAHFPTIREANTRRKKIGKAITGYCFPLVPYTFGPDLLRSLSNNLKTVVILRNPVDRAISHYFWDRAKIKSYGLSNDPLWSLLPDLSELVKLESGVIKHGGIGFPTFSGKAGVLQSGIYYPFINLLFDKLGRENVFIVEAAKFFAAPVSIAKNIYKFLDLPPYTPQIVKEQNQSLIKHVAPKHIAPELSEFYRPYNEDLFQLLGCEFNWY